MRDVDDVVDADRDVTSTTWSHSSVLDDFSALEVVVLYFDNCSPSGEEPGLFSTEYSEEYGGIF